MVGGILVVVLTIGAVVQAHEHKTRKIKNEYSTEREYSAADTAYDFEQSEMEFIEKVLAQLSALKKNKSDEDNLGSRYSKSDEDQTPLKIGVADSLDSDGSKEIGRSGTTNNSKQSILEYLSEILNIHRNSETKTNRRLDIEDNGDDFSDFVDIDNPNSNDYNQDDVRFKTNRNNIGYEAVLDMKGRSGLDGSIQRTNIFNDRALYRTPMTNRGLFITPGFYQYPTPPSITFSKIDNRDVLHPIGLLNSLPFRRLENQVVEVPTERADVALSRGDVASTRFEDSSTKSEGSSTWDADGNAYRYEPEDGIVSTPPWNYGR